MSEKKEESKVRVLCLGSRLSGNNKLSVALQRVDESNVAIGSIALFSKKKAYVPGGYYLIEDELVDFGEDGGITSIAINAMAWSGERIEDDERLAAVIAAHEAAETEKAAINQEKRAVSDKSPILDLLKPIRKEYAKTNAVGRLALEVRVLHYLRYGKDI